MNSKTKIDLYYGQAVDLEGEEPKSGGNLMDEGMEQRLECGNKENNKFYAIKDDPNGRANETKTTIKWSTQTETIGAVIGASWTGVNIWLNDQSGRCWLSRVAQEGAIIKYRNETQQDPCPIVNAKNVLERACEKSGFNLKIVQTQEKRECTLIKGPDKRTEIVLFKEEGIIKIKDFGPIDMGHRSYKDTVLTRGGGGRKKRTEDPGRRHEHVETSDWQGLSWILKMHSKEGITTREGTCLQSELNWA